MSYGDTLDDARARLDRRPRYQRDLLVIVVSLLAVYIGFAGFGLALGLDANGIVSTLQQVTFFAAVYALLALALNLHWGYTGLFNIGVAGFMAVGVYTMAMLTAPPDASVPGLGLPLWAGVIGGMVAAAIVGLVAALPALRLRADYLAIVTLGLSEIIRLFYLSGTMREFEIFGTELGTGGGSGMQIGADPTDLANWLLYIGGDRGAGTTPIGEIMFAIGDTGSIQPSVVVNWTYTLVLVGFVVAFYLLLTRIGNSPFGRVLKAIRDDELVAKSLGKNTTRVKITVFMLGCALMALGGMLWQGSRGFVSPNEFLPLITFYIFVALIVGGPGSNTGSIIGGIAFAAVLFEGPPFIQRLINQSVSLPSPNTFYDAAVPLGSFDLLPLLGYIVGNVSQVRFILVGLALIALMLLRPDGLLGHRTEIAAATDLSRPQTTDGGEKE